MKELIEKIKDWPFEFYEEEYEDGKTYGYAMMQSNEFTSKEEMYKDIAKRFNLNSLNTPNKQIEKWISVEDRLPEYSERVLINFEDDFIMMGELRNKVMNGNKPVWCCFFSDGFNEVGDRTVTHWQPIPKPPSEAG